MSTLYRAVLAATVLPTAALVVSPALAADAAITASDPFSPLLDLAISGLVGLAGWALWRLAGWVGLAHEDGLRTALDAAMRRGITRALRRHDISDIADIGPHNMPTITRDVAAYLIDTMPDTLRRLGVTERSGWLQLLMGRPIDGTRVRTAVEARLEEAVLERMTDSSRLTVDPAQRAA